MVLLNNYFLFASDLCKHISELTLHVPDEQLQMHWDLYILDRKDIGNLIFLLVDLLTLTMSRRILKLKVLQCAAWIMSLGFE